MATLPIVLKYLIVFFVSMVPIVELRGAIPIAESLGLNIFLYYPIAVIGNIEYIILPFKLPYSLGAAFVGVGLMHLGWIFFHDEKAKQMLNMTLNRTAVLSGVIIILIFANGYVNMRTGEYACIPLFWINAVFATLVGINISRFLEKFSAIKLNVLYNN